jgi:hypothetical protein
MSGVEPSPWQQTRNGWQRGGSGAREASDHVTTATDLYRKRLLNLAEFACDEIT